MSWSLGWSSLGLLRGSLNRRCLDWGRLSMKIDRWCSFCRRYLRMNVGNWCRLCRCCLGMKIWNWSGFCGCCLGMKVGNWRGFCGRCLGMKVGNWCILCWRRLCRYILGMDVMSWCGFGGRGLICRGILSRRRLSRNWPFRLFFSRFFLDWLRLLNFFSMIFLLNLLGSLCLLLDYWYGGLF